MVPSDRATLAGLTPAEVLGLTAYGEARSEPVLGIVGVLCVIRTRYQQKYRGAASYTDVCFQPAQFSCWLSRDPNLPVLLDLGKRMLARQAWPPLMRDRVVLETCLWLAQRVIDGEIDDVTGSATHFCVATLQPLPKWTDPPARRTTQIGAHAFFAGVA